jgi:hypothetical protein
MSSESQAGVYESEAHSFNWLYLQKGLRWLNKNFALRGLVFFSGCEGTHLACQDPEKHRNAVGRTFGNAILYINIGI